MADWTLEQIDWDDPYGYNNHDPEDGLCGPPIRTRTNPICKYCGKKNLRWHRLGQRWLLYEKKGVHNCPKMPLPLDVLKKLAEDAKIEYRAKKREGNYKRALIKGGVKYLITRGIKTDELLDLLEDLTKEHGAEVGDFWPKIIDHSEGLRLIREELLRRLK